MLRSSAVALVVVSTACTDVGEIGPADASASCDELEVVAIDDAIRAIGDAVDDDALVVRGSCRRIANALGINASGDAATVCGTTAETIVEFIAFHLPADARISMTAEPSRCAADPETLAACLDTCDRDYDANRDAPVCDGQRIGTCDGRCNGTCQGRCGDACDGSCAGICSGQCDMLCNGDCEGSCSQTDSLDRCIGACDGECSGSCGGECRGTCEPPCAIEANCPAVCVSMCTSTCTGLCVGQCDAPWRWSCHGTLQAAASRRCQAVCVRDVIATSCHAPRVFLRGAELRDGDAHRRFDGFVATIATYLPALLAARAHLAVVLAPELGQLDELVDGSPCEASRRSARHASASRTPSSPSMRFIAPSTRRVSSASSTVNARTMPRSRPREPRRRPPPARTTTPNPGPLDSRTEGAGDGAKKSFVSLRRRRTPYGRA